MQYYQMMLDDSPKRHNDILARPRIKIEDPHMLDYGIVVNDWNNDMTFECDLKEGYVVTDYLNSVYAWHIFSEKTIKLFGDIISNNAQLLPIKVVNKDTDQEIDKYFVVNVTRLLDALDLKNSVYKYYDYYDGGEEKKRLSVIKYGIKEEKVRGHHIFRLKDEPFSVFVSEKFYKIAKKNKILGCYFSKITTS
jgi:hypothetical protein